MNARAGVIALIGTIAWTSIVEGADAPVVRVIAGTTVVGDSSPTVWKEVLELLPERPRRIEILDLHSLSAPVRQKLRGLEAFVLPGRDTIIVVRQAPALRHAEFGDAFDRLVLASVVWHELAHTNGADERMAIVRELALWRRFIVAGRVDAATGLAYVARLREALSALPELHADSQLVVDTRARADE